MNLDVPAKQRKGSSWLSDPVRIQKRQERAFEIAKYANTREYIEGDDDSDEEVDEEEEDDDSGGEEAHYNDDGAARFCGVVDENIQVDESLARNATIQVNGGQSASQSPSQCCRDTGPSLDG